MESAKREAVAGIDALCGGRMVCGTCRVVIAPEWRDRIGEPSPGEWATIDVEEGDWQGTRLACQIVVTRDLEWLRVSVLS